MKTTYAEIGKITKSYRDEDGILHFEASKATGPDLDLDKQIVDADWAKGAMAEWFTTGGNLREQHSNIAAGKALTLESRADGEYISGIVVDPTSALKVETGVLTGISIGIKNARVIKDAKAPGGRIVGGQIIENSLVDRPALPSAKLVLAKAASDGSVEFVEEYTELETKTVEGDGEVVPVLEKEAPDLRDLLRDALNQRPAAADLEAVKALVTKADGMVHDPADIAAVRDGLVNLVIAELGELTRGENEMWDIADLLDSLSNLMCWWSNEAWGGETLSPSDFAAASGTPTPGLDGNVKTVAPDETPEPVTTEPDPAAPDADKAATTDPVDMQTLIKNAVAEVTESLTKAADAREASLREELDKVKALATPGGPARTRSPRQAVTVARLETLKAEQAEARRLASVISDPTLAAGYRERVKAIEAEINTLTNI